MFISLIRLRPNVTPSDIAYLYRSGAYGVHQLLWGLFSDGPEKHRDFLYRQEEIGMGSKFYTVSHRLPRDNKRFWEISSKEYNPRIAKDERLAFTLRVNPVRARKDSEGRQHRHDVIMEAKRQLGSSKIDRFMPEVIQETGEKWLLERCQTLGFDVATTTLRIDGYRQHRLYKGKGVSPISFSTIDINGILTVITPETFVNQCLFRGVGPAKGFGSGLMLVKRS